MIIDGHAHAMGEFGDPDLLVNLLDKVGVDKVVLCSGGFSSSERPNVPKIKESRIVKNRHLIMLSNRFLHSFIRYKGEVKESDVGNDIVYLFKQKYPDRIKSRKRPICQRKPRPSKSGIHEFIHQCEGCHAIWWQIAH